MKYQYDLAYNLMDAETLRTKLVELLREVPQEEIGWDRHLNELLKEIAKREKLMANIILIV